MIYIWYFQIFSLPLHYQNKTITIKKTKAMKSQNYTTVYDYYRTFQDMEAGNIYATFTDKHEKERLHFESLPICTCCRINRF